MKKTYTREEKLAYVIERILEMPEFIRTDLSPYHAALRASAQHALGQKVDLRTISMGYLDRFDLN